MNTMMKIGDAELSLADVAHINTDEIDEKRFERIPKGLYTFVVSKAELRALTKDNVTLPGIVVQCQVKEVHELAEPREDNGQAIIDNQSSRQEIFKMNPNAPHDWIGYFKAFASDTGYQGSGSLQELISGFVGTQFLAPVKHVNNPNDADEPYVNIDRKKIQPVAIQSAE